MPKKNERIDGIEMVKTWASWCKKPGTYLDVGSYSGLMSIIAARSNPKNQVHLVEPMERTIERASINMKLNGISGRVQRHCVAASDKEGTARINLYRNEDFLGTGNSIYLKENKATFGYKDIRTVALDDYLPADTRASAIKIDVEGHELACLRGLEKTISKTRPNIMIEVWAHSRTEVLALLEAWGYRCDLVEKGALPVNNYLAYHSRKKTGSLLDVFR